MFLRNFRMCYQNQQSREAVIGLAYGIPSTKSGVDNDKVQVNEWVQKSFDMPPAWRLLRKWSHQTQCLSTFRFKIVFDVLFVIVKVFVDHEHENPPQLGGQNHVVIGERHHLTTDLEQYTTVYHLWLRKGNEWVTFLRHNIRNLELKIIGKPKLSIISAILGRSPQPWK